MLAEKQANKVETLVILAGCLLVGAGGGVIVGAKRIPVTKRVALGGLLIAIGAAMLIIVNKTA
jgi:hypothetical protein